MTVKIVFSDEAKTALARIHDWFRENYGATPQIFVDELARAVDQLRVLPAVGPRYGETADLHIHRLLLRKTQHHIYYEYVPGDSVLTIITIWRCRRGEAPDLSRR
jgi:plasmid stabilization system protein ParE